MKTQQNKPICHELRIVAMNGYVFRATLNDALQVLRSRLFQGSLIAFGILIALVNPVLFGVTLPLGWRPVFWVLNCSLSTAVWIAQFQFCNSLMRFAQRDFVVPSGLFHAVAVVVLIWVNYVVFVYWLEFPELETITIWGEILRFTLIAVVFELMMVIFILPKFPQIRRVQWNGEEIEDGSLSADGVVRSSDAGTSPELEVQDRQIALEGLLYLKSVEHYVEFVFHEGRELLRAALRDLTEQLGPEHGIQTHRSYWVRRQAIDGLIRQNGHRFLRLKDGTDIPVSRTRRKEVSEWMQRFGPDS
ncbi:LytTR family transcriptional regulator [Rhodobacteraceae bacterium LMO-12]|nr:LytTR family transcriptional regulator [Rhodobacteraceae bacterium LMO-JJ12]